MTAPERRELVLRPPGAAPGRAVARTTGGRCTGDQPAIRPFPSLSSRSRRSVGRTSALDRGAADPGGGRGARGCSRSARSSSGTTVRRPPARPRSADTGNTRRQHRPARQPPSSRGRRSAIAGATSFDPPPAGSGDENPAEAPLAIDGNPSTFWNTLAYFGGPRFSGHQAGGRAGPRPRIREEVGAGQGHVHRHPELVSSCGLPRRSATTAPDRVFAATIAVVADADRAPAPRPTFTLQKPVTDPLPAGVAELGSARSPAATREDRRDPGLRVTSGPDDASPCSQRT